MGFPKFGFAKRLVLLYSIIFILVLLVSDWTLSHFLQKRDLLQLENSLTRESALVRELALPLLTTGARLQEEVKKISIGTNTRITIIDPKGAVLADSSEDLEQLAKMENHASRPEIAAALKKEAGMSIRYSITLRTRMLYVAIPILAEGKVLGVVRTATPITHIDEMLASVRQPVMFAASLGILIVLFAGIFFSHHLTKRIRRITSVAERYAQEDWSEKIMMDGRDELKMLAETMNQMASSLRMRIQDLENEKGKISVILNHMQDGVIAIDRHKQYVMANPTAEKIFGFNASGSQGKSLLEITRHPQLEKLVDQAFREKRACSSEVLLSGKTKKTLLVHVIVLDAQVRDIGGILVFHDMTELRRLENIRKEFVSNVSHELRTPLTSIKGFIETLLSGASKDPATSEKFLRIAAEETDRLGRLVEDILVLGEIEQGTTLMRKEPIDLTSELPSILERFKAQLLEKKIVLEDRLSGKPISLYADRDKVHQVLINLIHNAIKFNKPNGKVILFSNERPDGITITVEDSGVGIPEEAMGRIFERFFRVDKARSKELGGTGLGLAIVKHIMEAHGGHVSCKSILGQGSSFSVFFPAAR